MGLAHGAYCVGCCAALMLLLFVGGVMNLVWIAGLSLLVLAEKFLPRGERLSVALGVLLMIAGTGLISPGDKLALTLRRRVAPSRRVGSGASCFETPPSAAPQHEDR